MKNRSILLIIFLLFVGFLSPLHAQGKEKTLSDLNFQVIIPDEIIRDSIDIVGIQEIKIIPLETTIVNRTLDQKPQEPLPPASPVIIAQANPENEQSIKYMHMISDVRSVGLKKTSILETEVTSSSSGFIYSARRIGKKTRVYIVLTAHALAHHGGTFLIDNPYFSFVAKKFFHFPFDYKLRDQITDLMADTGDNARKIAKLERKLEDLNQRSTEKDWNKLSQRKRIYAIQLETLKSMVVRWNEQFPHDFGVLVAETRQKIDLPPMKFADPIPGEEIYMTAYPGGVRKSSLGTAKLSTPTDIGIDAYPEYDPGLQAYTNGSKGCSGGVGINKKGEIVFMATSNSLPPNYNIMGIPGKTLEAYLHLAEVITQPQTDTTSQGAQK